MTAPLAPIADALRHAVGATRRVLLAVHAPPRHGTTSMFEGAIAAALWGCPSTSILYATWSRDHAIRHGRRIARYAERSGADIVQIDRAEWRIGAGGVLVAVAAGESLVAQHHDVAVIDTPCASLNDLEQQQRAAEWIVELLPRADSVIVATQRTAARDVLGALVADAGFELLTLPAIKPDGSALAPHVMPLERLRVIRGHIGEERFRAVYQGDVSEATS